MRIRVTLAFLAAAIWLSTVVTHAQAVTLEEVDIESELIECGNTAYLIKKGLLQHEIYQLTAGRTVRVTLVDGEEFWGDYYRNLAPVNGVLVLKGGYMEGKKVSWGVFVVEGATAHLAVTGKGTPFTVKETGPYSPWHERDASVRRHSRWFLADNQLYSLDGHTVSEPLPSPGKELPMRVGDARWTGSTIIISTKVKGWHNYIMKDGAFVAITREGGQSLCRTEKESPSSWAGSYVALNSDDRGEGARECLRIEGSTAKPVALPKDTKGIWLFGNGDRVFAIHTEGKRMSILKLEGQTASAYSPARRAGKFGQLHASQTGDEWHVVEWSGNERKHWRLIGDEVQEIVTPEGWYASTSGIGFGGASLCLAMPLGKSSDDKTLRYVVVDTKGQARFVEQDKKPLEGDYMRASAATAEGFYLLSRANEVCRLYYIPKD